MKQSKVLIFGATGYIGKRIANASLEFQYPTHILARPETASDIEKMQLLIAFKKAGASIHWSALEDHDALVNILRKVDVVISVIAHHEVHHQYKLIDAIKAAGNIKKFYPSEFGMDVDIKREHVFPASVILNEKRNIRRTIEEAGIPHTYISSNLVMGWALASFAQFTRNKITFAPPREQVVIYGDGNQKVVYMAENDVAILTMKTVDDPRTLNRTVYFRPPKNMITLSEQVEIWEEKIGKKLHKVWMTDKEVFDHIEDPNLSLPIREIWARLYQFYFRGDLALDIGPSGLEASALYPEVNCITPSEYLDWYV